ncbi:hypothetical protein GUITHDRAFT_152607 [Guillardia theta CCMP2712]|uniref:Uncharacterized protein n=3 Tax=Guillardia theta TaxID=55529 RepID=L1JBN7_GUITC|nr:hypothetical protein GUITHDRAFT_152607 [Guillardia theta CCMP2712]EKX45926.1 hypothetical protein GUITHDRAFT_152607 [Guillardia theta CCMP2712]|eukprot:XP_005832906.1 hypothetical protein GUITHDRAFT_152607 [Guillardia theta CCMP2712]
MAQKGIVIPPASSRDVGAPGPVVQRIRARSNDMMSLITSRDVRQYQETMLRNKQHSRRSSLHNFVCELERRRSSLQQGEDRA